MPSDILLHPFVWEAKGSLSVELVIMTGSYV